MKNSCMNAVTRCIDYLNTTFVRKNIDVQVEYLKGKDDKEPRSKQFNFKFQYSLMQTIAIASGAVLTLMLAGECYKKSCQKKAVDEFVQKSGGKHCLCKENDDADDSDD